MKKVYNRPIESSHVKLYLLDEITRSKKTYNYGIIVLIGMFINGSVALFHGLVFMSVIYYVLCSLLFLIPILNRANKTSIAVAILIHVSNLSIVFFNLTFTHDMMHLYALFPLLAAISYLNPLPQHKTSLIVHTTISILFHLSAILIFVFYLPLKPTLFHFTYIKNGVLIVSLLLTASLIYEHNKKTQRKHNKLEQQIQKNKKVLIQKENALKDKNMLMAEIHHRVKNNLAVVSGILKWQKEKSSEESVQNILTDCSNRVMTMALVHKKLYEKGNLIEIPLHNYIEELCFDLKKMMEATFEISIDLVAEPILVGLNKATPCGLIVNEVVTNSIKHAFKEKGGTISISLKVLQPNIVIIIKDNGKGMPPIEEVKKQNSMGYTLITSLTEQLDGYFEYVNAEGTQFALCFPLN